MDVWGELISVGAVLVDDHFVLTSGKHSDGYIDHRLAASNAGFFYAIAEELASKLPDNIELIVGPETLGRTLAQFLSLITGIPYAWCKIDEDTKEASFAPRMHFTRLIEGRKIAVVDDLLSTGGTVESAARLVTSLGGIVEIALAIVRRNRNVTAAECGAKHLAFLTDVHQFGIWTPDECAVSGPCSRGVPINRSIGHGTSKP